MQRKLFRPLAAVALVALAASAAQARDNVFWSVGIDAALASRSVSATYGPR
jgi:hypothetical protein